MKKDMKKWITVIATLVVVLVFLVVARFCTTAETVTQTAWALVPPLLAIVLALVTKEVYSSLFVGVLAGALLYSGFSLEGTIVHVSTDGIIAVLAKPGNVGILIFLVVLGAIVCLMNKAGGSAAFGRWASAHIHSRVGAMIATIILGMLIFIDDYFNCLTVGSVMLPVTDKQKISRAKLAYLIDATAAPICIIAPISSWAAAVSGFVEGENGLALFLKAIPYNYYALLTIIAMVTITLLKVDFGPMALHEKNAQEKGDLFTTKKVYADNAEDAKDDAKGKVIDLIVPIICLIICCVIGMIYTGGFFSGEGVDFMTAFASSDASLGLAIGSFFGLMIAILWYLFRRVLSFEECMGCIPDGFKAMVPAILILTLAWSLKAMTDSLGAAEFVAAVVKSSAGNLMNFLPAIIFIIAAGLAFASGTSWGTFGILIPIVVNVFAVPDQPGVFTDYTLMIISISACMAGAVCGDHCSPISDTTIMASAGARCDHVSHVSTQLPYALFVAAISFIGYIVAGFVRNAVLSLIISIALLAAAIAIVYFISKKMRSEERAQA